MKQLIMIALLWYIVLSQTFQSEMERTNDFRALYIENEIQTNLSTAAIKGYFSTSDLTNIQNQVASVLGYSPASVSVTGTTIPQTRGQEINLSISLPTRIMFLPFPGLPNTMILARSASEMSEALTP